MITSINGHAIPSKDRVDISLRNDNAHVSVVVRNEEGYESAILLIRKKDLSIYRCSLPDDFSQHISNCALTYLNRVVENEYE